MKKERFGVETEPYKLCHKYNMIAIYVGDGFHPVSKKSFCYSLKTEFTMEIRLSDHFTYKKLIRFTLPSIFMMIFTSIYGVVDGYFVSNYVGVSQFAAVNFIMPFLMIVGALGFVFGTGGSALIAISMGEGDKEKANRLFSMFVYATIIIGGIFSILGIIYVEDVAILLGADKIMAEYCGLYGRIILIALVPFMLQMEFQSFFITAEKPKPGLWVTLISGGMNMILDWLFVGVLRLGLEGAAWATAICQIIGGGLSVVYFSFPNSSLLRLGKTSYDNQAMIKAITNGSSELMVNISMSLVNMLYNFQLMKYVGEVGVAAFGVLMYVNMIFIAIFIGYSVGTAPVFGFHLGAQNTAELKSLLKKSFVIIGLTSVCMVIFAYILAKPLSMVFSSGDINMYHHTMRAFYYFAFSFLFAGVAIFGSSFFTALGNGLVSALISFLRTLVFQVAAVTFLPLIMDVDGIWMSVVVAEAMAFVVTMIFIFKMRDRYGY